MASPLRARVFRTLAALLLLTALLVPGSAPALAADGEPLVLRAGTDQDLQVLNPFNSVVVADFEVYTLNYDTLVGWGQNIEPVEGFAQSWEQSADGLTWTFNIRPGMLWSDGEPATAEDARWTYQLVLDGQETTNGYLGEGYLDGYLTNAGVTAVEAPDAQTLVVTTEFPNTLLLQAYVPILPKHIWSQYTIEQIGDVTAEGFFQNEPPVVGTGPYVAVEWTPGEFIRFARNDNYWGQQGAADEVILQHFASPDTMVQALRTGEIDYVRGVNGDQFDALEGVENIATVEGFANGYTELSFNTGGTKEGYGGSTPALSDVAFRDALGYAIDKQALVDAVLNGHGVPGDTIIPPFHTRWHVAPDTPRTFDIEEAKRRLQAAGYELNGDNRLLDKEGNPITLRLTWPDSESENGSIAPFLVEWFGELGIEVDAAVTEEGKLIEDVTGPPAGPANYDIYMWGWVGDPDPTSLLNFFRTEEIGGSSDSYYSNPDYDEMYDQQRQESDEDARHEILSDMQNLVYDEAPYHILYYDAELHAYRTDKFGGWQNQPEEGGTPLFGYGSGGYNLLTDLAQAGPSAGPSGAVSSPGGSGAAATPAPSAGGSTSSDSSSMLPLILGIGALVVIIAVGLLVMRGRRGTAEEE